MSPANSLRQLKGSCACWRVMSTTWLLVFAQERQLFLRNIALTVKMGYLKSPRFCCMEWLNYVFVTGNCFAAKVGGNIDVDEWMGLPKNGSQRLPSPFPACYWYYTLRGFLGLIHDGYVLDKVLTHPMMNTVQQVSLLHSGTCYYEVSIFPW